MEKEELRKRLINIKAIADYEKEDPFVGIFFEDLFELFEEYEGQDLLYVCNKTTERTEKRLIDKACEWLEPVFKNFAGYYCGSDMVDDFRKAMEE